MSAIEARELKLYIDNDADLHRSQHVSILKNLATKKARGAYEHPLAVKLFGYLVEAGAKKYAKEFGSPGQVWHQLFPASTRKAVAEELTTDFEDEHALGNYDHLLPKKYQQQEKAPKGATIHASKKIAWKVPEGLKVAWSPVNQAYFVLWPASAPLQKQQVLKVADADEMHSWLRERFGEAYGRLGGKHAHSSRKAGLDLHTRLHDPEALRGATDRQLRGFYRDEKLDVAKARAEGARRGMQLHARKKTPRQLDQEIAARVPSWRGGR